MALLPIKTFIIDLLEKTTGSLSTTQIYAAFEKAGYELVPASIRGRLNTLTYEGRINRVGFGRYAAASHQFFNLLMSGNSAAWDRGSAEIGRGRFLEHTKPEIAERFSSLTPDVRRQLMTFPALFAYEHGIEKEARVGRLTDVHLGQRSVDIWFEFDEDWPPIEQETLGQIKNHLGFEKNEDYRTHWAVKQVDLYSALIELGIERKIYPELEQSPTEPPPGPGPQYAPVNGKLSEVASSPTADEVAQQLRLHSRLRDETLSLVQDLERVGNRYPELLNTTKEYSRVLNVALAELDVTGLWCVGGSLAQYAASYRAQNLAKTLSEPLEPQIEAQLQSTVRLHGAFIMGFHEGRDLVERADAFLVDADRLKDIERPGNVLLAELVDNRELIDERTRALHRPIRDSVLQFGWTTSRVGYSAYVTVRNCFRAIIKFTVGEERNVAVISGLLAGASVLFGDPNAEFIRAAIPVLQHNGGQLFSFFNHSPEMLAYVEWALRLLESDASSNTPSSK